MRRSPLKTGEGNKCYRSIYKSLHIAVGAKSINRNRDQSLGLGPYEYLEHVRRPYDVVRTEDPADVVVERMQKVQADVLLEFMFGWVCHLCPI